MTSHAATLEEAPALIVDLRRSWIDQAVVLVAALAVYVLTSLVPNPWWTSLIHAIAVEGPGPQLFRDHLLWQLPRAILSGVAIAWLVQTRRFAPLSLSRRRSQAIRDGLVGSVGLIVFSVLVWWAMGGKFFLDLNFWKMAGNVFSNAYEELTYRGLLLAAFLYCFRNKWIALLASAAIFGFSHTQYPLPMQLMVVLVGGLLGWLYLRSGNLLAPWIVHQLSDMVLDAILKT